MHSRFLATLGMTGMPALGMTRVAALGMTIVAGCGAYVARPPAPAPVVVAPPPPMPVMAPPRDSEARVAMQGAPAAPPASRDTVITAVDVTKRAVEVFGDSIVPPTPALDSAAPGPSWDIEVHSYETTARVSHYVQYFSGPAKERIQERPRSEE